ncbi:MAG: UDP-N-acetylmuramoyl-L-alanine--D-glutamate ligase [bacterium]|nr:UDP-N-acetylmuramoyl-L-alanine--D-glutamate ligase [bacterium]MDD5354569.1 UDP-N-acetylmuramoyl-L-alanine--D-glutamate ligase [bacterium]MDD5755924.1 UDP-N-acetylmuramoyl-L-alanine--D-glutamate ligase [bacterium]
MFVFSGKRVLILGAARSGIACASLLLQNGAHVTISDNSAKPLLQKELAHLRSKGAIVKTGGHPLSLLSGIDYVIISPGIRSDLAILQKARLHKIRVLSEIEVAYTYISGPVIGITGTNGKTTTTSLVGEIFRQAGRKTLVCGNIGLPISAIAAKTDKRSIVIAEISSFQLENIVDFRPHISVMLNITPDHLDRYPGFAAYAMAKKQIYRNQEQDDYAVINYDDLVSRKSAGRVRAKVVFFSRKKILAAGVFVKDGIIIAKIGGRLQKIIKIAELRIPGPHNLENALAAIACGVLGKIALPSMKKTLKTFHGVEHRLEQVKTVGEVQYINDSKATNVDSVVKALESFEDNIILIAGGRDKGSPYLPLARLVRQKVKALIVLGEAKNKIKKELGSLTKTFTVKSLAEAVKLGQQLAAPGDTVLLSPACASFDMFRNYEERGRVFKEEVKKL